MLRRFLGALPLLALLCVAPAGAQLTPLTLDQVFGVNPPWGLQPSRTWAPDSSSRRRVHSIAGIAQRRHLYGHMLEWWLKHL